MKALKILGIAFLPATLLSSCLNLETIINIDIPKHTPVLVVNEIHYNDTAFCFQISRSRSILSNDEFKISRSCKIELYENDSPLEVLHGTFDNFYRSNSMPKEGKNYSIIVTDTTTGEKAEANTFQPTLLKDCYIKSAVQESGGLTFESFVNTLFQVKDPNPGQQNYFRMRVLVNFDNQQYIENYKSSDPSLSDGRPNGIGGSDDGFTYYNGWAYFSDDLFDGKTKDIRIYVRSDFSSGGGQQSIQKIEIQNLSYDLYRYALTSDLHLSSQDDPFSTPVQVHNNIKNGRGIFAGASRVFLDLVY